MGEKQQVPVRIELTQEELTKEINDLQPFFDEKVLRSPVFIQALAMSMEADTMAFNQGGGMLRFGDDETIWIVGKGDSSEGMHRLLSKETDEEILAGQIGRVNNPSSLEIVVHRQKEKREIEEDPNTDTAASTTRDLIADFARYRPKGELKVYAVPVSR